MNYSGKTRSVLRYPGGKAKAIKNITPLIPREFIEFREPFVGGGSVFLYIKQLYGDKIKCHINDLNFDLYCFWDSAKNNNRELIKEIQKIKDSYKDGRDLYNYLTENNYWNNLQRAVRFFVLNRITFSGTTESGGFSNSAFKERFTQSSIDRLSFLEEILKFTVITNRDYEDLLFNKGDNVFVFLDPPYFRQRNSRLYGVKGDLHTSFDHERLAMLLKKCRHKWLMTIDDTPEVLELYSFANIKKWELQYGMNNYMQAAAKKGKELFVANYKL